MIRLWNALPIDTRIKNNYPEFLECMHLKYKIHEYKIINLFHYDTEVDNMYMKLRYQWSKLNADQFKFNFIQNVTNVTKTNKKQYIIISWTVPNIHNKEIY